MTERILICGSRSLSNDDERWIRWRVAGIKEAEGADSIIIVGGARGADRVAEEAARKEGFAVELFPADWDKHGKSAGFIRNKQMVDSCDSAIVIWDGKSPGTKHTISLLMAAKKPFQLIQGECAHRINGY